MKIVIAARDSKWALAATRSVVEQAQQKHPGINVEVSKVLSPGDVTPGDLAKLGGTTSFVGSLSRDVALGRFDGAVHTVKDISWPSLTSPRVMFCPPVSAPPAILSWQPSPLARIRGTRWCAE
ncbi:MAG: hypothetical protein EBZ48_00500 [Proteobacteria bacterium]|nr:hypothetical protein [Pseudomonadota bacterium]